VGLFVVISGVLSNAGTVLLRTGWRGADADPIRGGVLGPGVSVIELSVAVNVPDRDGPNLILSALRRLSNTARTDSRVGVQDLTSQVALKLLRQKSYIVAAPFAGVRTTAAMPRGWRVA
jgi:hypothetical protein